MVDVKDSTNGSTRPSPSEVKADSGEGKANISHPVGFTTQGSIGSWCSKNNISVNDPKFWAGVNGPDNTQYSAHRESLGSYVFESWCKSKVPPIDPKSATFKDLNSFHNEIVKDPKLAFLSEPLGAFLADGRSVNDNYSLDIDSANRMLITIPALKKSGLGSLSCLKASEAEIKNLVASYSDNKKRLKPDDVVGLALLNSNFRIGFADIKAKFSPAGSPLHSQQIQVMQSEGGYQSELSKSVDESQQRDAFISIPGSPVVGDLGKKKNESLDGYSNRMENKFDKKNNEWARKPGESNEVYDQRLTELISAEVHKKGTKPQVEAFLVQQLELENVKLEKARKDLQGNPNDTGAKLRVEYHSKRIEILSDGVNKIRSSDPDGFVSPVVSLLETSYNLQLQNLETKGKLLKAEQDKGDKADPNVIKSLESQISDITEQMRQTIKLYEALGNLVRSITTNN